MQNCQNYISMYHCSPIAGSRVSKCHGLMDVCSQKIFLTLRKMFRFVNSIWNICVFHTIFLYVGIFFNCLRCTVGVISAISFAKFVETEILTAQKQKYLECLAGRRSWKPVTNMSHTFRLFRTLLQVFAQRPNEKSFGIC